MRDSFSLPKYWTFFYFKKAPDSTSGSPQSGRMLKFLKNFHIYIQPDSNCLMNDNYISWHILRVYFPPYFRANFLWYKKIDDFLPQFLVQKSDPHQIWKKKFLILHENKFMHIFFFKKIKIKIASYNNNNN